MATLDGKKYFIKLLVSIGFLTTSACAYFTSKPDNFLYSKNTCDSPFYVDATATIYPAVGDKEVKTVTVSRHLTVDATTNPMVSKESELDQYIVRILIKASELTGCKFQLYKTAESIGKIDLQYITNANETQIGFWHWISGLTLTILPNITSNRDVIKGRIEIGQNKKEFNYFDDSSFFIGIIFLPLMPFGDSWDQTSKNLGTKLANDFCEVSKSCGTP